MTAPPKACRSGRSLDSWTTGTTSASSWPAHGPGSHHIAPPRRDDRRPSVHPQRTPGHRRRQPARPSAVLAPVPRPAKPTNLARFAFVDPRAPEFFPDWDDVANTTVALLRVQADRDPDDRNLSDLVGELATRSDEFRTRWAAHNVRLHDHGEKRFHHPVVGDLSLSFEELPLPADTGLTMTAFTAEAGSASHDGLTLLASWVATLGGTHRAATTPTTDRHIP